MARKCPKCGGEVRVTRSVTRLTTACHSCKHRESKPVLEKGVRR